MQTARQILKGIMVGLLILTGIAFGIWKALRWYVDSPEFGKQYFVSQPAQLAERTISNDVWHWYDAGGITPLALQRVDWSEGHLFGPDSGGYFIYFKGHLVDSSVERKLRELYAILPRYFGLPSWASHAPSWWYPQVIIPANVDLAIVQKTDYVFARLTDKGIDLYWIKKPWEGEVYTH